jgi:hypothetical protein
MAEVPSEYVPRSGSIPKFCFLVITGSKLLHCKQRFGQNFGPGILLAIYQNAKQHHHFFFRWVAAINI